MNSPVDLWCIDSGCTAHLCNDKSALSNVTEKQCDLKLASNSTTAVKAKGDIQFEIADKKVILKDTLYVPDLRTNLISVAKIVNNDCEVTFNNKCAIIKDNNSKILFTADRIGDLFFLRGNGKASFAVSESKSYKSGAEIWHARLGHLNFNYMTRMLKDQCVDGFDFDDKVVLNKCATCLAGKMTSIPFTVRENPLTELLELIHMDVCGPMRLSSIGGARYFITFIDDFSRLCSVYFLKNKSEAVDKFMEFKNLVEN